MKQQLTLAGSDETTVMRFRHLLEEHRLGLLCHLITIKSLAGISLD